MPVRRRHLPQPAFRDPQWPGKRRFSVGLTDNEAVGLNRLSSIELIGAGERNRTPDRLITNQLLYLLSYTSF